MENNKYFYNLSRSYKGSRQDYQTPKAKRLSDYKRALVSSGLPVKLNEGEVFLSDRGDLIIKYNDGRSSYYIDAPETITIKTTH